MTTKRGVMTGIDTQKAERIQRNIAVTRRFFRSVMADPATLDDIPDGATLFLVPDDYEEGARLNLEGAARARRSGQVVHVQRIERASQATLPDGPPG